LDRFTELKRVHIDSTLCVILKIESLSDPKSVLLKTLAKLMRSTTGGVESVNEL